VRRILGLAVISLLLAFAGVAFAALPPGGTFVDDNGNPHEPNIEAIAAAGITKGCNPPANDYFCPRLNVTRAEMAAFLLRGIGEDTSLPSYQGYFSDVPAGQWFTGYVERLFELGISNGYPDGTYRPTDLVTRGEMAAFILRALKEDTNVALYRGLFSDVVSTAWYALFAERLYDLEITKGCAAVPLQYCPDGAVKRDEMASFLARALGLTPIPPPPASAGEWVSFSTYPPGQSTPALSGFRVLDTEPTDGEILLIDYEAEWRTSPIAWIGFGYEYPSGFWFAKKGEQGGSLPIGDSGKAIWDTSGFGLGQWTLYSVTIWDLDGRWISYGNDGSVTCGWYGAVPPDPLPTCPQSTHTADLSNGDITITSPSGTQPTTTSSTTVTTKPTTTTIARPPTPPPTIPTSGWDPQACTFDGIPMWGRVQVVDFFPDVTVQVVDFFPDLRVQVVDFFPYSCGRWQQVDFFPDFTVQIVDFFPDLRIQYVNFFPGT